MTGIQTTYFEARVQHFSHCTTGTSLLHECMYVHVRCISDWTNIHKWKKDNVVPVFQVERSYLSAFKINIPNNVLFYFYFCLNTNFCQLWKIHNSFNHRACQIIKNIYIVLNFFLSLISDSYFDHFNISYFSS